MTEKKVKRVKFSKWVYRCAGGPLAVARLIGADRKSIYDWIAYKSSPSVETVKKLIKLSKGKLKLDDF